MGAECGVLFRLISCRILLFPRFSLNVILNLQIARFGMTSEMGMHLYFTVCPPRDDFAPENASPFNEISSKRCIDDKNMDKINREESSL